jgi:hypothetical protein
MPNMLEIPVMTFLISSFSLLLATATYANELEKAAVVTRLQMQDKTILIKNNGDGLKYSVKTKDGTVVSANLTESELAKKHPDLYETIRPSVASSNAYPGIWAGM